MRWLIVILFACDMNPAIINNKGSQDTGAPGMDISSSISDPVLTASFTVIFTATKGPISNFVVGDITTVNCTLTNFTTVSDNVWTATCNPTISGTFTLQVAAGAFTWNNISSTISNLFSKTYDPGTSVDLENASEISKATHYWGKNATFSEITDTNYASGEMMVCRENLRATIMDLSWTQVKQNEYLLGACDFGNYTHVTDASGGDFATVNAGVTQIRGGDDACVLSYGGGTVTYAQNMRTLQLAGRNSDSEHNGHQETSYGTGITDAQWITRAATIRFEYYGKSTAGNFFAGTWAQGVTKLGTIVPAVVSANEFYTNFTHWYKVLEDYLPEYFELIASLTSSYSVAWIPYGTAVEFYWNREAIDSVSGSGSTITINHTKKYASSPYSKISSPTWIKVNLTGTTLAGNDIALSNGLKPVSAGSNVFYIPVVLDYTGNQTTINIGQTSSPNYVNFSVPVVSRTGQGITSDQNIKARVWSTSISNGGSSSTSLAIPTTRTTVSMTLPTGMSLVQGSIVKIYNDATHYFVGVIVTYTSGTGAATIKARGNVGTGTFSSWTVYYGGYEKDVTVLESMLTASTSQTMTNTITPTTKVYYWGFVNEDKAASGMLTF